MFKGKSVLAIIPARGGSRRLPGKNIKSLGGKPLIAWTIEAARNSSYLDRIILSSDDVEIIKVAQTWKCEVPFIRPAELASSSAKSEDVVRHALSFFSEKYDYFLLLQPTSPFRTSDDIDAAIELCIDNGCSSVVSMCRVSENPQWMCNLHADRTFSYACKVSMPDENLYIFNGAIYLVDCKKFLATGMLEFQDTKIYVMNREQSVDIDTLDDFQYADFLLRKKNAMKVDIK